ncbi:hypothetical protein, partial [uncultured Gimesia sp.]|uniref:hypothetical protein n=1 Tax=uncultured Gimesia sp. TaxID=1678688 RepID=UPI0026198435
MLANAKIAEAVINQMNNQIDLLFTITTTFCGGIVVLTIQIIFHNSDNGKQPILLSGWGLLLSAFIVEGLSVVFGYLASGCLTSLTPTIYSFPIESIENWTHAEFTGHGNLKFLML